MTKKYDENKDLPLQFCPGCKLDNECGICNIRNCIKSKSSKKVNNKYILLLRNNRQKLGMHWETCVC